MGIMDRSAEFTHQNGAEPLKDFSGKELQMIVNTVVDKIMAYPEAEAYLASVGEPAEMTVFVEVFDENQALYARSGRINIRKNDGVTYVSEETQISNKFGYIDDDISAEWSVAEDGTYTNLSGKSGYQSAEQALENLYYLLDDDLVNVGFVEIPTDEPVVTIYPNET